jgi:hypothetical protein
MRILAQLILPALLLSTSPKSLSAAQDAQAPPAQGAPAPTYTQQNPDQMEQLVAPIALYPDSLVAQILAASTFPEQVVQADRWVQAHPDLKGTELGKTVDQQPWDPSVSPKDFSVRLSIVELIFLRPFSRRLFDGQSS